MRRRLAGEQLDRVLRAPGRSTSKPSRQPPGEPGRFTTSAWPRTPASPRESRACGVFASESARSASAIPGATRSSTSAVASGVTSRGPSPVPPVVSTTAAVLGELGDRLGDRVALVRHDPPLDLVALLRRAAPRATSPLSSSRVPSDTPSETVSTAGLHDFVFSTSRTSPISIALSIAFAMS